MKPLHLPGRWLMAGLPLALAACATTGGGSTTHAPAPAPSAERVVHAPASSSRVSPYAPAEEDLSKRGDYVAGGLFRPGVADSVPDYIPDVDAIPEPDVRDEPLARAGNRDYAVLGKRYRVLADNAGYAEEGMASYYGSKFHGRRTSSQEVYDMYAFTAAHKTLPLPSFARVTNLDNGKSIVVRVNDRGPFHPGRVIDLSYAAAVKLGYRDRGSARVRVEALRPGVQGGATNGDLLAVASPPAASRSAPVDGNRFAMHQDGKVMSADAFDAWLAERRIRVATGKPLPVATPATASEVATADAASTATAAAAPAASPAPTPPPAAAAANTVAAAAVTQPVTLQVASFSDRNNAQQALSRLQGAAIASAQLQDADVDGRKVWRLRIGPVAEASSAELSARVVGLGFGLPRKIRE